MTPPHTEQEIKGYRTVGVTPLTQFGGSFLATMGGGFRSNSQSSRILENRAHLIEICRELEERALPILQEFAKHNSSRLDKQAVVLERRSTRLFVVEKSTNSDLCVVECLSLHTSNEPCSQHPQGNRWLALITVQATQSLRYMMRS